MKAVQAPLSRFEETALRKVGFGSDDALEPAHVRRLLQLGLIDWKEDRWQLTAVGRDRYCILVTESATSVKRPA